jgi:DNA-binding transcriptional LysR family regulator
MMNLDALKIFCDVVRRRSFCRGAEENRVTQSSASQTIHQIERRLGPSLQLRQVRFEFRAAENRHRRKEVVCFQSE